MAWTSCGATNDEMVDSLKRNELIRSPEVVEAFRAVDRRLFVPPLFSDMAYEDQPLKDGNVHISAPHIDGIVVEALELRPNLCVLNLGSGTGYTSCVMAHILGRNSRVVGVEVHADAVEHSRSCLERWLLQKGDANVASVEVIHGNALQIDTLRGACLIGFDRIYIGARTETENLDTLKALLRPGGILVGTFGDELTKVVRSTDTPNNFSHEVLTGARFTPLVATPAIKTVIPSRK